SQRPLRRSARGEGSNYWKIKNIIQTPKIERKSFELCRSRAGWFVAPMQARSGPRRPSGPTRRMKENGAMKVMVIVKATKMSEAGTRPSHELPDAMTKYNDDLVKSGILLAGDGLQPSSKGKRVHFNGGKRTVVDGPFAETKEL